MRKRAETLPQGVIPALYLQDSAGATWLLLQPSRSLQPSSSQA